MEPRSTARTLDKFYTAPAAVDLCLDRFLAWTGIDARTTVMPVVEPSAGGGAFLDRLPDHAQGYDIAPEHPRVRRQNFLALRRRKPALVVGNPPFGKNAHLAVAFFNHAARFATHIGFVVPRSFQKTSVHNRLDARFHLVGEEVLDPASFLFEGQTASVPCVFQVWEKRALPRPRAMLPMDHPDFTFTTREEADFAVQRVGVRAGTVKDAPHTRAKGSHHFIKAHAALDTVRARFEALDVDRVKHNTSGNPSIAKTEIVALYDATLCT
jgi:hypothetical protein